MNLYQIKLQGTADTTAWAQAHSVLHGLTDEANRFVDSLRAGVGIDLGGKLVNSIAQVPTLFQSILQRGVAFDKNLGDSEIGIANVLAKFQDLDAKAAKQEAAKAMAKIVELEPKVSATLSGLTQGFLATIAPAQAAGITIEENIDLVGKFSNALANANIPAEQLSQELRAIFTGNITPDAALAKILNISNADITKAKEAGNLYKFLRDQLGSIGEAGDTAGVAFSTLSSAIDKAAGELAKPLFELMVQGAKELAVVLADPVIRQALQETGVEVANLAHIGLDLTKWAIKNADSLIRVAQASVYMGEALAGIKLLSIIGGLIRKAQVLALNVSAISAETAALRTNTAAQGANSVAKAAATATTVSSAAVGNAAAKGGAAGAVRLAEGFATKIGSVLGLAMSNAGLIISLGIAAWKIEEWIGDRVGDAMDTVNARLSEKSITFGLKPTLEIQVSSGDKKKAEDAIAKTIDEIETKLNEAKNRVFTIKNDILSPFNKGLRLDANAILIKSLELDLKNAQRIQAEISKAISPEKAAADAAAIAAAKQAELNEHIRNFAEESGDLQAKVDGLRAKYEALAVAASKITGLNLNVAPGDLQGALKTQVGPDTLSGKNEDKKLKAIDALIKAGADEIKAVQDLEDKNKQAADQIAKAQADQHDAALALLELEQRLAEAKGDTAKAEEIKANIASQKLADELVKNGAVKNADEAGKIARNLLNEEANQKKKIAADKLSKLKEEEALEKKVLEARASGNEKQIAAAEDVLKTLKETARLKEVLGLSDAEALRQAKEKVSLERTAAERGSRNKLDDKFDALPKTDRNKSTHFRGLAEFDELQSRTTRSTFKFPALDAFQALQNDPARRFPVSSVANPFVGPPAPKTTSAGITPAANLQSAANALETSSGKSEQQLAKVTESIERIARLLTIAGNDENGNYTKMLSALRQTEAALEKKISGVQSSVKTNRA